jgi:beta-xylosidase
LQSLTDPGKRHVLPGELQEMWAIDYGLIQVVVLRDFAGAQSGIQYRETFILSPDRTQLTSQYVSFQGDALYSPEKSLVVGKKTNPLPGGGFSATGSWYDVSGGIFEASADHDDPDLAMISPLQVIALAVAGLFTLLPVRADPAQNPIIWADVPDLAMIRVGDTYYMSSTTMHLSPGLPLMKSRDLVNWHLIGYAYDTLGDHDPLKLQNGRNAYGAGSWASSLRYHQGTFFVTTFSSTTGKTHVYRTKDIEKGEWTENSFRPSLHDHTLFFDDDGRVYMIYGGGNLRLVELTAEVSGLKPGGVDQVIITNASRVAGPNIGLPAEGSQMGKINGKYYLFNITWPRGGVRTVIIHRADTIAGPYEGRAALQDKGVAQGGLIDTPQGDWYAYLFRDYGAVGRTPYLVPVKWEDGWPVLGVDGKVPDTLNLPASKGLVPGIVASDEFDRRPGDPALPPAWQWNHNPDNKFWSLTQRPGFLRLTTGRIDAEFLQARNTPTQRTIGPECSGTTAIDVTNMKDGDFAGLALLQKQYGLVGVKSDRGTNSIVMINAKSGSPIEVQSVPVTRKTVFLKAECDFKNRADTAHFFYSLEGKSWTPIGNELKMSYTLPHFMGYRYALFNYATKTAGGFVDFDFFRVRDQLAVPR